LREEFSRNGKLPRFYDCEEENYLLAVKTLRWTLLFARVSSTNGGDLITVTNPKRSPSRSHVSVNAKEFMTLNKKAHHSLSQDIVELRLFSCDMSAMLLRIQTRKEMKKYWRSMCLPRTGYNNVLHARQF